jgi:membrane protease YdiL (CAAX protease family)
LAPIIEEFVFRFAFYEILKKKVANRKTLYFLNALLFSISHAGALSVLPKEFFPFIFFQIGYTFILGWICTKAKDDSNSIVEPIILHFVFNFLFYLAVVNQVI